MSHYQPTFDQMEDKREVRGLEYDDGEWTGRYFQPTLLCTHRRAELAEIGFVLEESMQWFSGEGIYAKNAVIVGQKCDHAKG